MAWLFLDGLSLLSCMHAEALSETVWSGLDVTPIRSSEPCRQCRCACFAQKANEGIKMRPTRNPYWRACPRCFSCGSWRSAPVWSSALLLAKLHKKKQKSQPRHNYAVRHAASPQCLSAMFSTTSVQPTIAAHFLQLQCGLSHRACVMNTTYVPLAKWTGTSSLCPIGRAGGAA